MAAASAVHRIGLDVYAIAIATRTGSEAGTAAGSAICNTRARSHCSSACTIDAILAGGARMTASTAVGCIILRVYAASRTTNPGRTAKRDERWTSNPRETATDTVPHSRALTNIGEHVRRPSCRNRDDDGQGDEGHLFQRVPPRQALVKGQR